MLQSLTRQLQSEIMEETPSQRLTRARIAAGYKTPKAFADAHTIPQPTYHMHEKGKENKGRGLSPEKAEEYAALLGNCTAEWILYGRGDGPKTRTNDSSTVAAGISSGEEFKNEATRQGAPELPIVAGLPRDLPVMGSAQGGDGYGDFELNGQVVDWIRRPPALKDVRGAFAVAVVGTSMEPRFEEGEVVFIHPGRRYSKGRDVLIELVSDDPNEPVGPALIKRFVAESTDKLIVEQMNPPKRINIPRAKIKRIGLILRGDELFRE